MKHLKHVWLLVVLLALAACGRDVAPDALKATDTAAPTITSDKADYAPGELVTLTGSNWQAGESVQIVVDDDGLDVENPWKRTVTVNADDVGNITDQFNLPNKFVADYVVTATGETSGTATTTFTDANVEAKANLLGTATTKVKWVLYNTKDCTGDAINSSTGGGVTLTGSTASPLFGAGKNQSLKLTAEASSSDNKAFDKWTDASGTTLAKFGNDATTTCQTGFNNGEGVVTFTANYAAAPAVTTTSVGGITASTSTFGGKTDLSATVTPKDALGKVDFYVNSSSTALEATYTKSTGVATLSGYEHKLNAKDAAYSVKVVFTSSNTSTHTSSEATKDALTVGKAEGSVSISNIPDSATVGGTFTPTYTKAGDGTASTTSKTTSICTVTSGVVNFVAAGSCKLEASVTAGTNHLAATGAEQIFTVAAPPKQDQTITFAQPTSPAAFGSTFNVAPTSDSNLPVSVAASGSCSISNGTVTITSGSGTCTLKASQAGDDSYKAADDVTRTLDASKANQKISFATGTPTTKKYGDESFNVSAAATSGLDVSFAAKDNSRCSVSSSGTVSDLRVGDCVIVASQGGNDNYNAAPAVEHKIVVGKAAAEIILGDLSHTYNGSPKNVTVTTKPSGLSVTVTYDGKDAPTDAGSYNVVATVNDENYEASQSSNTLIIAQADATIKVEGYEGTYDGKAHGATGSAKGVNGEDLSSLLSLGDKFTDVPGGKASWSLAGGGNYKAASGSVDITISKAKATVDVKGYEGVYDGNPHGATGSAQGVNGETLAVNLGDSFTNVPGGTATWSFDGDGNYEAASGSVDITITKAEADISVTGGTYTYDGNPHGATGSAKGVKGESLSLNLGDSFTNVPGGTANWSFAGDGNYEEASGSVEVKIAQADAIISVTGGTHTYDGAAKGATGTARGVDGKDLSNLLDLGSSFKDVPGGTANWSFAGDDNHKSTNGSADIVINKADQSINFTGAPATAVFGDRFTVSATGGASGQAVVLAASGACTVSGDNVTMTSGTGTCSLTANQAGNNNYNAAPQVTQSITAQKATATVSLSNLSHVFDGSAKSASATTSPAGLNVSLSYSPSSPVKVGNYSVNATISDQNYQGNASGTLTISAWKLSGFYSPVDMGGTLNNAKAGSTVPLKFEVFAGSTELTSTSVISTFTQKLSCAAGTGDDIEQYATGSTSLRYDTTSGQFIFNWQTPKAAGSCYRVTMTTQDGSSISADFRLR